MLKRKNITDVILGDQVQMNMAILFADIRNFTTMSEKLSPEENFNFLNIYLKRMGPIIRKNNGFVDKYIGDAIMALFPEGSDSALKAALDMRKELIEYNNLRGSQKLEPIEVGIGIHCGELMLGTIGEQERMEGTVISDTVNLAARLEQTTKVFGSGIIISQKVLIELDDPSLYLYRFLARMKIKGKEELVGVIEVFDGDSPEIKELKLDTRANFEKAQQLFMEKKMIEAKDQFEKILKIFPNDKACKVYIEQCLGQNDNNSEIIMTD